MDLRTYQLEAIKTAVYPTQYKVAYPMLGLIGEIGEFKEAIISNDKDRIIKEAGDCCWYAATLAFDLGLHLSDDYHLINETNKNLIFNFNEHRLA